MFTALAIIIDSLYCHPDRIHFRLFGVTDKAALARLQRSWVTQ